MSWEAWGDPPEPDPDPLDSVEFPRERKPWKRDRFAALDAMQRAIADRRKANWRSFPAKRWSGSCDHSVGDEIRNQVHHEIRRCLLGIDKPRLMHFSARHHFYLGLHRFVMSLNRYDWPPLPGRRFRNHDEVMAARFPRLAA